ncbi:hypothetical protein [Actinomadura parmotrematis]|uniref:Uncharacterized protein n=1 Tax=Actinomadura parmotrematis TaxID=2864039 RepID=A0ABS7G4J1_9ACTN|nr:hypothetical protein [Actinomadura parmotrematis]MBW8487634.1 hypothetical protein [Actinomadura parmotrematis]
MRCSRRRIVDDFVAEVTAGLGPDAPAMGIARSMREPPESLPDVPAFERVIAALRA